MRLVVEEGYNRGAEFALGEAPLVLGRGDECSVQLLDDGVSRRHAEVSRVGAALVVRDLGSRNGTRVNGVPVASAEVFPGDRIAVGGIRFLVAGAVPAPGSPPSAALRPTATLAIEDAPLEPVPGPDPGEILGDAPPLRALLAQVGRVAPTSAVVLIQGESGTGKELVTRAVHRLSPRRRGPFVVVNGAALPSELVESELFGHEKGAFTGALARRTGLAEAAQGGTLFLDEVGELASATQAKLLRFLESGEILRVGATVPRRLDVRVVAATHRDLDAMVREGTFREDLLHRIRVVELRVPALRERPGDVRLLASAFLRRFSGGRAHLTEAALAALEAHPWPGNVRELRNAVEAAFILAPSPAIDATDLPARVRSSPGVEPVSLEAVERRAILRALERAGGNRTRAAEELGIDRKTLAAKLKAYGVA